MNPCIAAGANRNFPRPVAVAEALVVPGRTRPCERTPSDGVGVPDASRNVLRDAQVIQAGGRSS